MNNRPQNSENDPGAVYGLVERITFHAEESGYSVLKVRVAGRLEPVTVVGKVPVVTPGETLEASGEWVNDPEHGRQFKAKTIRTSPPESLEGIERYLGSGLIDGIGPVYAKKLVDKFGAEVIEIIENRSQRLEEIDGVGPKRRREIKESWSKQRAIHAIMIFLHDHGISTTRAVRIYQEYGDQAVVKLKENPYQLARDLHGVGFKTADEIARDLGMEPGSPARLSAGVLHVLQTASTSGHTCLPAELALSKTADLLGADPAGIQAAIIELIVARELVEELVLDKATPDGEKRPFLYLAHLHSAEHDTAGHLHRLAAKPVAYPPIDRPKALAWCQDKLDLHLAGGQADAVDLALRSRVLVITGGPGTGKTTIMRAVLSVLGAKNVAAVLAAPTGRAAKRLSESSGLPAKTLHRLLEYQPGVGWARNRRNPLEGDLFVIDEASMIDLPLMDRLLDALPDSAHLLLVGDSDQLPSVGPGNVLGDIIRSRAVPVAELTEIFRQAAESRIVRAAHEVNSGRLPDLNPEPDSDFFFIPCEDGAAAIRETVIDLVSRRLPARYRFDPANDIQVLTPMQKNELGARALNIALQHALNPEHQHKAETPGSGPDIVFRAGDKVIQLRNNYDKEVYNGDIGHVRGVESDPIKLHILFEDGRTAAYEPADFDQLGLAYAITIHKSQGSEFPAVVVPLAGQHHILLQRNLLYTALTRGRRLVVVVGEKRALGQAVRTPGSDRFTTLGQRLG